MKCEGCNILMCPKSDLNKEDVDLVIKENLNGVDINSEKKIKDAKLSITLELIKKGIKPCVVCMEIDKYIESKKEDIIKII